MNNIQIFNSEEFGKVRVIEIDGEPWFVARDIAVALGYAKPENAVRDRVKERDTLKWGISDANNHNQQMIMTNEPGMYALIFGSKLESAEKFQDWVTHDVLPSIRKTGSYNAVDRSALPTGYQVMYAMMDNLAELRIAQDEQKRQLAEQSSMLNTIQKKQDAISEAFVKPPEETLQDWAWKCVKRCAESEKFTAGDTKSDKYKMAATESYERLNKKRRCRLDMRLKNAIAAAVAGGLSRSKAEKNITKLKVICDDKNLSVAYEAVVKEMMMCYCVE